MSCGLICTLSQGKPFYTMWSYLKNWYGVDYDEEMRKWQEHKEQVHRQASIAAAISKMAVGNVCASLC